MGKVYQNDILSIGAATSDGANKGMFGHRTSSSAGPITIQWSVTREEGNQLFEMSSAQRSPKGGHPSLPVSKQNLYYKAPLDPPHLLVNKAISSI